MADLDSLAVPPRDKFDPEKANDSKVGKLLYEMEEKFVKCDENIEWTSLQFYEHVLLFRNRVRCCCFAPTYTAGAVPRFKILNVTFVNGKHYQWFWVFLIFIIGLILLIIGVMSSEKGLKIALSIFGVIIMILSPIPLFLGKKWRYITFGIKGSSGGKWFSTTAQYTFRFDKTKPDEAFILDYIFGPLKKGRAPFHALAHYTDVSVASPVVSRVTTDMKAEDLLYLDEEQVSSSVYNYQSRAATGLKPAVAQTSSPPSSGSATAKVAYATDMERGAEAPLPPVRPQRVSPARGHYVGTKPFSPNQGQFASADDERRSPEREYCEHQSPDDDYLYDDSQRDSKCLRS